MRKYLIVPACLFVALTGCTGAQPSVNNSGDTAASLRNINDNLNGGSVVSQGADAASSPNAVAVHTVTVEVSNWQFSPDVVILKKGEKAVIHLVGVDGVHSFQSNDLGINVSINPGETKDIDIPTYNAGTFSFRCSIPCGEGHDDMTGQIVIK